MFHIPILSKDKDSVEEIAKKLTRGHHYDIALPNEKARRDLIIEEELKEKENINKEIINEFRNKLLFLSNFFLREIKYKEIIFPSAEHLFHSFKTHDTVLKIKISELPTPEKAKKFGRKLPLIYEWDYLRDGAMYLTVYKKFQNKELREKLNHTKGYYLIEGNVWHDNYWGDCFCNKCKNIKGKNKLGYILMKIRDEKPLKNN